MNSFPRKDHIFHLGRFAFDCGTELPDAYLGYATYGQLDDRRDNVIVAPTMFSGTAEALEWLIGPGRPLDTDRYFVVVPSLFANGISSSPSNTPPPFDRIRFPRHTIADNVRAQHRLLVDGLGATGIQLIFGASMGSMQAYEWAVRHPDLVQRVYAVCGSSRVSEHCGLFLRGAEAALTADQSYADGEYETPPADGLRAVARTWAAWSPSAGFFRDREYRKLGFATAEAFVSKYWEPWYATLDANNFLSQLWTWQHADVSGNDVYRGDLAAALTAIAARTFVVASERDPYFPADDAAWEAQHISGAELRVIPGTWGHFVLTGSDPESAEAIGNGVRELLDTDNVSTKGIR